MKSTTLLLTAVLSVFFIYSNAQTEAEMKAWQAYMTPGESHKLLASMDGTWEGAVTMWQAPGTNGSTSTSTSKNEMVLGGRYQVSKHNGNMMGMPFEGMSTTAFDNARKVFISTWIDNVGTGMMVLEGKYDPATKTITMMGKVVDPSKLDGSQSAVRETLRIIDADHHVMEMYGAGPDGKEYKMMEIKYSRKK